MHGQSDRQLRVQDSVPGTRLRYCRLLGRSGESTGDRVGQTAPPQTEAAGPPESLLRNRNFMLLWAGQSVFEVGTQLSVIAVPVLAATTLGATALQVSLLTALGWLPYLIFSLPAGVVADRVDQRRLMITCDLVRMVLMVSIPAVSTWGTLTLGYLYAVIGVCGVLTVLFNVAHKSQLPALVHPDQLLDANGRFGTTQSASELAGPALAGVLIGAVGGARTLIGNGLAFLVSALALWLIRLPQREGITAEEPGDGVPVLVAIRQGISFVRHHRILRMILLCTTVSNFFTMGLTSVEIVFMVRVLHSTPVVIGLLFTLGAVGGFVSGLLAARVSRWLGSARVIWLSMLLPGPFYLLMPLARPGWWVLLYAAGTAAFSANIGLFNASATSYRLAVCPPGLLGRVNATFLWVCYGAIPLGAVTGGLVAAWLGLRGAVLVCVVGIWSAALFVVFSPLRSMRDVPSGEQPTG